MKRDFTRLVVPARVGTHRGDRLCAPHSGPHAGRLNLARIGAAKVIALSWVLLLCGAARADAPATQPTVDRATLDSRLGVTGTTKDGVYCVEVPRKDLHLTIDGDDVPTAAGIASHFYFYTCPCGKTRVIGEFVLCDYEVDDVLDALHEGWLMKIDAISPMLNDEKPRLRIVRFHGEGSADAVGAHLRAALDQTGDARTK
jgi:hypothetical protein